MAATRLREGLAKGSGLHLTSPDSSDQPLLFTIVRTLEERSWISTTGALFLGGHEMKAPYVLTYPEGRLVVNGYSMPDLVLTGRRHPPANGELEARRTIAARLAAQRDSLLARGIPWKEVQERLKEAALKSPFVKGVSLNSQTDSTGSFFTLSWSFGYNLTLLGRKSGGTPVNMGGRAYGFDEDRQFWTARLGYLKGLLDEGSVLFLLGGGCEYVVGGNHAKQANEAARRIAEGVQPGSKGHILAQDVQDQLRHPLTLERLQ